MTNTIAETSNFIILNSEDYQPILQSESYQTEQQLEQEFIKDLENLGYEFCPNIKTPQQLLDNLKIQIENLNKVKFNSSEWQKFLNNFLDNPSDTLIEKTRKLQDKNHFEYFRFDNGEEKNLYILDKENLFNNKLQVINQFQQDKNHRYDVSILINGLPIIQIELKKRGTASREAFNQQHRYTNESFNKEHSLFKYLQIFVISNGTDTKYFSNTTKQDKNSFDFTINWAFVDNFPIKDLKDFTATFFQKHTILKILVDYCVFDSSNTLLIMRPYQIAAVERLLERIKFCELNNQWGKIRNGGYIWHTTGSGKTLTSFKAAQLARNLACVDKVLFVVDRKDLDYQTLKEYRKFSSEIIDGSNNTLDLERKLRDNNKITITTIQKLNNLIKSANNLAIYNKKVVFIFDECHRSQFGEAQKNIRKKFKKYCQFGFTGTPIFKENALRDDTTESVFGVELHNYVITDAIRDNKVLKFKVDYNDVRPQFRSIEKEQDEEKISAAELKKAFSHPERIKQISQYILDNFRIKTNSAYNNQGFNAIFAVSSIEVAKLYYEQFKLLQKNLENPLKIATIFSFASNEEQNAIGEIEDENPDIRLIDKNSKQFLSMAINDYNQLFKSSHSIENFEEYYRDLSLKVKETKIDLLIVVSMFLTGFDAPRLNTLFVDKNLSYHGLIQAFSRTNRIYDKSKSFGNIVCFRDLEDKTIEAIQLYGNKNAHKIILERNFDDYIYGYQEDTINKIGYVEIVQSLEEKFPNPAQIFSEKEKKEFVKLFGKYIRTENVLRNFDEFTILTELNSIDKENKEVLQEFQEKYNLSEEKLNKMQEIPILSLRKVQNYLSTYWDIRNEFKKPRTDKKTIDWEEVVFEIELLKSQEINLDYILTIIYTTNKKKKDKEALIEDIRYLIRASLGHRAKEKLIIDFINYIDLDSLEKKEDVMEAFFSYANNEKELEKKQLIKEEKLNINLAAEYLELSLKKGYASDYGEGFNKILPAMNRLENAGHYLTQKENILEKIKNFVEKFKGIS